MSTSVTLDLRGVRCPMPIVRLNNQMKQMAPGQPLGFVADDPAFLPDVQAWARRFGLQLHLDTSGDAVIRGSVCRPE